MSVLFKALARAAKTRDAMAPSVGPTGQPWPLAGRRSPGLLRRPLPLILAALVVCLLGWAGLSYFGEDAAQSQRSPASAVRRPPQIHVGPQLLNQVQLAPQPSAPLASAPQSPASNAAVADATPPTQAVQPVQAIPAPLSPSPTLAQTPSTSPTVAGSGGPRAAAVRPVESADADLPAILERIRRSKTAPAIAQPVAVVRSPAATDVLNLDGTRAVSVSVSAPAEREDATSAYDLLLHGRYAEALAKYQAALRASPNSVALLLGKATAEQKLLRATDARDTYRRILSLDPENRAALTNMTALVAAQAPEQALVDLQSLRRENPAFSPILAQIATIAAAQGNVDAAIAAIDEALRLAPDNGLYRLNLAILLDRVGRSADAAASYQAALDLLGPDTPLPLPIDQIRQRLRYLQGR